jgi:hypothetical protein
MFLEWFYYNVSGMVLLIAVEPFQKPPKISPVCIQYDTTDANLEHTVYVTI